MGSPKKTGRQATSTPGTGNEDRRNVCRYPVIETRAWLGWWDDLQFRNTNAVVLDLSLRGCMMTVEQLPPADLPVWFCAPGMAPSEWIEARLVETRRRLLGRREVRIAFRAPFPYETFKHMVYGPDALGGQMKPAAQVPESERDYW